MAVNSKYNEELRDAIKQQPKLSALDLAIWLTGAALSFALCALLWYLLFARIAVLRELEPGALAVGETGAMFWGLPGVCFPFCVGLICLIYGPDYRVALFGRRGAEYCGSTHRELVGYPLFMDLSEAPEPVRKRVWKERKTWIGVLAALAVCLYLFTWSWNGRQVIQPDGSLQVYSGQGSVEREYAPEELERFTVRISAPGKNQPNYELDFMVRYDDGRVYRFWMDDRIGDVERYIRQLLALKEQVGPEVFRVEDEDWLEYLIRDQELWGEKRQMLYELFSLPEK